MPRNELERGLWLGSLLVIASAAGYAFLPIFTRQIYAAEQQAGFDPIDVAFVRFLIAVAGVWMVVMLRGGASDIQDLSRAELKPLLALGAIFGGAAILAALSLERVPATTYTLLFYTYPAMVALINLLLGERLPWMKWGAIALALVGCGLTISGKIEVNHPLELTFPLMNAFAYSLYLVVAGRYNRQSGLLSGAVSMTGTLVALLPIALIAGLDLPQSTEGWGAMAGLGLLATVLPIVLMFRGILYVGASNAAIISTVEPIMVVLLAAIILGERITATQLIGGTLIIMSVLILNIPRRQITRLTRNIQIRNLPR